jgi:hypothetical protein
MTLQPVSYKTRTIVFKKTGNLKKKGTVNLNRHVDCLENDHAPSGIAETKGVATDENQLPIMDDFDMGPTQEEPSTQEEPEFQQTFFGFPDQVLWVNNLDGVRFQSNNYTASSQIHVLQDFDLVTQDETQFVDFKSTFVCVYLVNFSFTDSTRQLVAICSSKECSTASDLNRLIFCVD